MTTDTDFHLISNLKAQYIPAKRGILSQSETELIEKTLELSGRTDIELQNVRDMSVMLYGQWAEKAPYPFTSAQLMDAMSGICAVIDKEKSARGLDV